MISLHQNSFTSTSYSQGAAFNWKCKEMADRQSLYYVPFKITKSLFMQEVTHVCHGTKALSQTLLSNLGIAGLKATNFWFLAARC
jgi:hypothetical protein